MARRSAVEVEETAVERRWRERCWSRVMGDPVGREVISAGGGGGGSGDRRRRKEAPARLHPRAQARRVIADQ